MTPVLTFFLLCRGLVVLTPTASKEMLGVAPRDVSDPPAVRPPTGVPVLDPDPPPSALGCEEKSDARDEMSYSRDM